VTACRLDVLGIGNAVVDVIASADDAFLEREGMVKSTMCLLEDLESANSLYERMGPARETSGGSVANTMAGIAALGGRVGFIGQVADDQWGAVFRHDITAQGVEFTTPPLPAGDGVPTGRILIMVTPDAQRTMRTSIGGAHFLPESSLDAAQIEGAAILYLEGYMWGPPEPRAALVRAMDIARKAGRKIAFTVSDPFCIENHRDDFRALIEGGGIDILFANEAEIKSLKETDDFEAAVAATAATVPVLVVTRSGKGAICVTDDVRYSVPAAPIERMVDTTGAGDLFAAGFLFGYATGRPIPQCLAFGAICAGEIISHFGARPETDLKRLLETAIEAPELSQLELPGLDDADEAGGQAPTDAT
jgi:sugar/nucleoside kinase (ribokinase family)